MIAPYLRRGMAAGLLAGLLMGVFAFVGVVVAVGVLFFALPAGPDPGDFPSGLPWVFRLSSLGALLVFWAGLVVFGLIRERADRREPLES